jgi:hypothetical protein
MRSRGTKAFNRFGWTAAAVVCGFLLASAVSAQDASPPPVAAPAAPADQQVAPAHKPGLFEAIGRWIDRSSANFRSHLRGARERADSIGDDTAAGSREISNRAADVGKTAVEATRDAVEATRGAVDTVVRLPGARVIKGHERCATAPNGAPDCRTAAQALCRKHGYASGKSMDFTAAEECPARVMLSGREPEAECRIVTFISRAMCQP